MKEEVRGEERKEGKRGGTIGKGKVEEILGYSSEVNSVIIMWVAVIMKAYTILCVPAPLQYIYVVVLSWSTVLSQIRDSLYRMPVVHEKMVDALLLLLNLALSLGSPPERNLGTD